MLKTQNSKKTPNHHRVLLLQKGVFLPADFIGKLSLMSKKPKYLFYFFFFLSGILKLFISAPFLDGCCHYLRYPCVKISQLAKPDKKNHCTSRENSHRVLWEKPNGKKFKKANFILMQHNKRYNKPKLAEP